ncbi:TPA: hypothetical protein EYP45_02645 [Candidatus Peregrinibacteria bacterium]|nr:hypothetical protein [Candidatus Peregrinibacteria bacterium]
MNEKLFTFPAQVFPEISGLFRESRVVFQEVKEAVPVASKKPEEEKKISLADALTKTKNTLLALKTEVDKKDGENKTIDGIEKTIDTDAEKEKLRAFISSHKALDNLMGKISEDKKEESLNAYQNYFETGGVGSIENMTQIEAVHEQIVSLIEGDVKYVEAVKSTEKVGAVNKSAAVIFLEKLPESFKTLTDVKTQSEIVDDSIKILNITETFKEPLTKESSYSSGALVDNIYSKIIQSENYNEEIKERFKDDENKIEFKKWIANSITKKIDKLGSEKKDEKLYVSISFEDKITIKTQEEVDQEKKTRRGS